MSERTEALARMLIRNFNDVPTERERREPLYDSICARLARGTAARKLGASIDTVAPGMRSCPYHFHHAQEEMFVVVRRWPSTTSAPASGSSLGSRTTPVMAARAKAAIGIRSTNPDTRANRSKLLILPPRRICELR